MVRTTCAKSYVGRSVAIATLLACSFSVASAQSSGDAAAEEYAALLQQISDLEVSVAHQEVYVGTQEKRISALQSQIDEVPALINAIDPMLDKIKVAVGREIALDLPFDLETRNNRLGAFEEILEEKEARPADKMRRALTILDAEVSYGQSVQAYAGNHPIKEKVGSRLEACEQDAASAACNLSKDQKKKLEDGASIADIAVELKDGYYLRYGRLALAYMQADEADILRYDEESKAWVAMSGGKALDIRRAMKMARGESAPTVVQAPIYLAN